MGDLPETCSLRSSIVIIMVLQLVVCILNELHFLEILLVFWKVHPRTRHLALGCPALTSAPTKGKVSIKLVP